MSRGIFIRMHSLVLFHLTILLSGLFFLSCTIEADRPGNISWTIMFYGNGDNNLENNILSDLKEMELSSLPEQITIIALVDRPSVPSDKFGGWSDTKLFRVVHGNDVNTLSSEEIASEELALTIAAAEELNMSDASVITKLLDFCKLNFPSDRYALIIGSHGDGWKSPSSSILKSIGYDSTSYNTSTSIANLAVALKVNPPDLIVFDACNMGNLETLYELTGCAGYIAASPNPLPLSGFDYTDLVSHLDSDLTPADLGMVFASSWKRVNDDITMMVYSMDSFSEFINYSFLGNSYIDEISSASISDAAGAMTARNTSTRYSVSGVSDHIDIVDYCENLMPGKNIPFSSFILTNYEPMLSVYFPASLSDVAPDYDYTSFAVDTLWNEALDAILE